MRRLGEAGACRFVFVSIRGRKLHCNTVRGVFRRLVYSVGVARLDDKLRPRLLDLRFYFANQVLTHSPGDHDGIGRHMVALTTYLGHSDVRNGYWYLEAIEKALPPELRRGVFQVDDKLIAWLTGQKLSGVSPWEDPTNSQHAAADSS